jgi:hypothetical protein
VRASLFIPCFNDALFTGASSETDVIGPGHIRRRLGRPFGAIRSEPSDVFKAESEGFGPPLPNALSIAASPSAAAEALSAAAPGEPEPLRKAAS